MDRSPKNPQSVKGAAQFSYRPNLLRDETGYPMELGIRPMTIIVKGYSLTFDMPGWYCDVSGRAIHVPDLEN